MCVYTNHHPMPSSPSPPIPRLQLLSKAALPFIKAIDSCWKRWWMVVLSSSPKKYWSSYVFKTKNWIFNAISDGYFAFQTWPKAIPGIQQTNVMTLAQRGGGELQQPSPQTYSASRPLHPPPRISKPPCTSSRPTGGRQDRLLRQK